MKQGSNKRSRGRGNRKPSRSQVYDSNGPEGRIRGNANQVYDKYLALGRDAYSSGDRISAENFFQHAEHYYRIMMAIEATRAQQQEQRQDNQGDRGNNSNRRSNGDGHIDHEDNAPHDPRDPIPVFDEDDNDESGGESRKAEAAEEQPKPKRRPRRNQSEDKSGGEKEAASSSDGQSSDAQALPEGLLKPLPQQKQDSDDGEIRHSSGSEKPRTRRPRRRKEEGTEAEQAPAEAD